MSKADESRTSIKSVLVAHVRHTSDGFSVYVGEEESDQERASNTSWEELVVKQFVGPVARGQRWTLAGRMERDERLDRRGQPYGEQFAAAFATLGVPRSPRELDAMLSSGLVDFWSWRHYALLQESLGPDGALQACVRDRQQLTQVPGISDAMIESLAAAVQRGDSMATIYAQLSEWEVTGRLADKLVRYHGLNTVQALEADPYKDILAIDGYGWKSADSLGNRMGILANDPRRLTAGISVALHEATWQAGHTWLTEFEACKAALRLLGVGYQVVRDQLDAALEEGQIVVDGGRLYPAALHRAEEAIADQVCQRDPTYVRAPIAFSDILTHCADISDDQYQAVVMALRSPLSLLTGGPGVGKTTTLRTLVEVARAQGLQPTCMAPTGKAAARMSEATGWPASTIHSKLKITPGKLDVQSDAEGLAGLVIVDEVSMLDTTLAAQLLSRLDPSAQLLLVGDPEQLPSVGPGAVLRDLLDANVIPRVHLDKVFRNDAGVAITAARIRAGENILPLEDVQLLEAESPAHAAQLTQAVLMDLLRQGYAQSDLLVLTPTNDGPSGRYTLNAALQPLLNSALPGDGITQYVGMTNSQDGGTERRKEELRIGDRVMVTKNSSELGVFNGQVGCVIAVQQPKSLDVEIDGNRIHFYGEDKRSLTLAYCITGHKSQGSEAKIVIAPIFASRVLSREWLYTVLTRARERAYLIGDVDAMQACLSVRRAHDRRTGLASRIHARLAAERMPV